MARLEGWRVGGELAWRIGPSGRPGTSLSILTMGLKCLHPWGWLYGRCEWLPGPVCRPRWLRLRGACPMFRPFSLLPLHKHGLCERLAGRFDALDTTQKSQLCVLVHGHGAANTAQIYGCLLFCLKRGSPLFRPIASRWCRNEPRRGEHNNPMHNWLVVPSKSSLSDFGSCRCRRRVHPTC